MLKRSRLFPLGAIAIVAVVVFGASSYLRSIDTSLSGYLSGLMVNFWGGGQDQLIRVNLYTRSIALYEHGNLYAYTRVAGTGNPNDRTATPTGRFRILSKDARHISTLSGVIMPLSMRFYEGYYFHDIPLTPDGRLIDTKYSHGCIRLPTAFAKEMFDWTKIGAYVQIYSAQLVRADDADTVYVLTEDGYRRPISSERVFEARGYRWQDVAVVPGAELSSMPLGGPIR